MSIYAIGDVQGCFTQLMHLLELIQFDEHHDQLWFTGDLVNRGENSLAVLRMIKNLNNAAVVVLGNHDLHLLASYYHSQYINAKEDTFTDILNAPDADVLCDWLRRQPLLHYDSTLNFLLVHAGIAPHWTVVQAKELAREVETVLQSDQVADFLLHLYGHEPAQWDDTLQGYDRLRCIINYCTRMRFCDENGRLNLTHKGAPGQVCHPEHSPEHSPERSEGTPEGGCHPSLREGSPKEAWRIPWFDIPWRKTAQQRIIFGHWAALQGKTAPNIFGLDTGCVWGSKLTAMRLEDLKYFQVDCSL